MPKTYFFPSAPDPETAKLIESLRVKRKMLEWERKELPKLVAARLNEMHKVLVDALTRGPAPSTNEVKP